MKKLLIGMLGVALVLFGAAQPLVMPWRCPVTHAAFEQIEKGMTIFEVAEALGGSPGDYRTQPTASETWGTLPWEDWSFSGRWETWIGDEIIVQVRLAAGVVEETRIAARLGADTRPFGIARWRLQRLKDRWLP